MKLFNINLSKEEFDALMVAQANGKELVVENGKVVARDREIPKEILIKNEMSNISNWFNADYTKNEQKFRRLYTLKLKCDDGADPLEKLTELYKEAEEKRKLYQQYEKEITENGTLHGNII